MSGERSLQHSQAPRPGRAAAGLPAVLFGAALLCVTVAGCAQESSGEYSSVEHSGADLPDILATVAGEQITMEHVRGRSGSELDKLELQYLRARHKLIEETMDVLIRERVLFGEARSRSRTVEDLVLDEAGASLVASDVEIAAWYEDNRARLGNRSLEQVRSQIADHLREERRNQALARLEARLYQEYGVDVHFEPLRIEFDNRHAPALGPTSAPVTLVEFSDFQCPFCASVAPTLKQVEREFGDDVRIVYRHFPLTTIHPYAFKAAEASMCAHDQGEFWAMHDLIFQEQNRVSTADLKEKARRLGLNQREFDTCLDSGRHAALVQEDFDQGQQAGITGTPALFVNGVMLEGGAVSFEVMAEAIRKELARPAQ